jgi:hypothetical protein
MVLEITSQEREGNIILMCVDFFAQLKKSYNLIQLKCLQIKCAETNTQFIVLLCLNSQTML